MQAMIALIKREYLEHRGAFVFGPIILLTLFLLGALYSMLGTDISVGISGAPRTALRFYETAFALGAAAWLAYLIIMLFFYYSDAFSADSRSNSMLFWKSMPQSDFKILGSKMAASLTVFPTAILLALALTGIIAYLPALTIGSLLPGFAPPDIGQAAGAWVNVMVSAVVLFALTLLWYLPFFAWVGLLATAFRRWAIPLAFFIPVVIGMIERVVIRRNILDEGVVWPFLSERFQLRFAGLDFEGYWLAGQPWNGLELAALMLNGIDWVSLIAGVVIAVVLVFAASEYRRRYVLT